jgi:hypothetical protein
MGEGRVVKSKIFLSLIVGTLFCPPSFSQGTDGALALDPKSMERKFGTLASLVGTYWQIGNPEYHLGQTKFLVVETVQIEWDRPGEGIIIKRRGSFGGTDTIVVPAPSGKSLRYARLNLTYGHQETGDLPMPKKGVFNLLKTGSLEESCRLQKRGSPICTLTGSSGVRFAPYQLQAINPQTVAQLQSEVTFQFPDRPIGSYHPTLGLLAEASGKRWGVLGTGGMETAFVGWQDGEVVSGVIDFVPRYWIHGVVFVSGNVAGPLQGTFPAPITKDPASRGSVVYSVLPGGIGAVCISSHDGASCGQLRVSASGKHLFYDGKIYEALADTSKIPGFFNKHNGRYFIRQPGSFFHLRGFEDRGSLSIVDGAWEFKSDCAFVAGQSTGNCFRGDHRFTGDITGQKSFRVIGEDVEIAGERHSIGDGFLVVTKDGVELGRYPEVPFAKVRLLAQARADERWIDKVTANAEYARAENRRLNEQWNRSMAGLLGQIASGEFSANTFQPSTPADWSIRSSANTPGFGSYTYVPVAPASPEELAKQEELARFKIREELYGNGVASTASTDSAMVSSKGSSENATSDSSSASSSGAAREASRPAPPPARPAPRLLEVVLTVVPSVSEKDKTQPLCISTVMTLGNWPEGPEKATIASNLARQHFARFVSACRNARGDLRSALPETVNFVTNESADTDLRAYIDQARATGASWLVPM